MTAIYAVTFVMSAVLICKSTLSHYDDDDDDDDDDDLHGLLYRHSKAMCLLLQKSHTPLHVASLLGKSEIVKLLLRRGADVNIPSHCFDVRIFHQSAS